MDGGVPAADIAAASQRDGKASVRIADGLRACILSGELPPGTRIRQEDVAARFRTSRIPVRGALRILESDGLVTLVANSGAWVARFSLAECQEVYQTRERIEPLLVRYSIPAVTPDAVSRMDELADLMESAPDPETFLRLDREFHLLSYSGADTVVLGGMVQRLWNMTQHYRLAFLRLLDPATARAVHDEHRMLARALQARDEEQAELVVRCHIRRTRLRLALHSEVFGPASPRGRPDGQKP